MASFDVVVPCYNYGHFLKDCVESVLEQADADVRVLIIDDTSKDNTPDVCAALAARDKRVSFTRHAVNQGHIKTFNEGVIDWAEAEYTLLISADDLLAPNALSRAAKVLDTHGDVHMAYGRAQMINEHNTRSDLVRAETLTYQIIPAAAFIRQSFVRGTPAPSPTCVVRTEAQKRVGGYGAKLRNTSDLDLWMRFALVGDIAAIKEVQAGYRWHAGNMSNDFLRNPLRDFSERIETCEAFLREHAGVRAGEFQDDFAAMERQIGEEAYWFANEAFDNGDEEAFRASFALAQRLRPDMKSSLIAARLYAKSLLGVKAGRAVRKGWRALRGAGAPKPAVNWFKSTKEWGWWPEPEVCETSRPKSSGLAR